MASRWAPSAALLACGGLGADTNEPDLSQTIRTTTAAARAQSGPDHVDGHRSIFLAISPWVKHEHVSKTHLSLASIFKTVHAIFGLPALNQYDAAATDLRNLFTATPDFTPYDYVPVRFDAQPNASWSELSAGVDFSTPDADEVRLRHAILTSEGLPRLGPPLPPRTMASTSPSHSPKGHLP